MSISFSPDGKRLIGADGGAIREWNASDGRLLRATGERGEEYPAREAIERLGAWTAPIRAELGIEPAFPERNGAQRQRRMIEAGATREEVFAASVGETRQTYAEEVTV